MDTKRIILYAALVFVSYTLWTQWQRDYPQTREHAIHQPAADSTLSSPLLPIQAEGSEEVMVDKVAPSSLDAPVENKTIQVKTDVLDLTIDLAQGDIIDAKLLDYPVSVEKPHTPFPLLNNNYQHRYVANSQLFSIINNQPQGIKTADFHFTTAKTSYRLNDTENQLIVTLNGKTAEGLEAKKRFVFKKGSYLIDISYQLMNESPRVWTGYLNTQLLRNFPSEDKSSLFHVGSYTGASYSSPGKHRYQKVTFKDMMKANLDIASKGGWIAMQQHYFLTAWIPPVDATHRFYSRASDETFTIGAVGPLITLSPSAKQTVSAQLYLGPEKQDVLQSIAPGLDLTVDYGWLWFLSSLLFSLMKSIHSLIGNWGWSIVLVTVLIKLAFYRLSATSYKSMAAMRKLQPKLQALKERYPDDKAKVSQATMELYRQEKVNPLGGCLPILIQIPVFIALYWVLLESVQLRQAPFIGWINDLSAADPYHILPVVMGLTMLIQQRLNPAPPDPMQAKIMMFLPVLFTALFWGFPAGLVLYWIVNNSLSILQQWYITRKYEDKPVKKLTAIK